MATDDKRQRKRDRDDEDAGLTPQERDFKRTYPNTWEQMQRERREQKGDR